MDSETIIEFIPESHQYLVNGVLVPSVTSIIKRIFPDKYKGISSSILNKKAQYGTIGHQTIENIGTNLMNEMEALDYINSLYKNKEINQSLQISLREYLRLCRKHKIEPIGNEVIVNYGYEFVGTLDMIANINDKKSLLDIKFTSELDKEYLSWQLGMYKMAYGEEFDNYYCLWLPKGKIGQLVPIKIKTQEEILKKLKELKND